MFTVYPVPLPSGGDRGGSLLQHFIRLYPCSLPHLIPEREGAEGEDEGDAHERNPPGEGGADGVGSHEPMDDEQ